MLFLELRSLAATASLSSELVSSDEELVSQELLGA